MDTFITHLPMDRRQALVRGTSLPEKTRGVALFADISGFTPLTETLAKELGPKRGAEEVLRHINPIYETLITELHRYQGSVISFAGDSITCWFNEPSDSNTGSLTDAAGRALTCALAMQRAMRHFATVETAAGTPLTIAVKIALAGGVARRLVVGDPAIQLIDTLVGEPLDRVATGERLAQKGEVLAGAEVVAAVGATAVLISTWRQDSQSEQKFGVVAAQLKRVKPEPWPELSETDLTAVDSQPWLLTPVHDRIQGGSGFLAELRPAVAIFIKFDGLDYDHDDQVRHKLDAYIRWAQAILHRYEGHLLQLTIGDKGSYLYACFGALLAHDDDAVRAIAAALDLRQLPPELNFINKVQIGLSQGRMWSGAYGAHVRRAYSVMGMETNLAARLMSNAMPGQILVSQRMVEAGQQTYLFNDLGLITVKGKAEPISVAEVVGRRATDAPMTTSLYIAPLVGREETLQDMAGWRTLAGQGAGQLIRLEGAAGVGKSHLTAVFTIHSAENGWRVISGQCASVNQGIAYLPWRQIFYDLLDVPPVLRGNLPHLDKLTQHISEQLAALNPAWLVRLPLLGDLLGLPLPDNPTTAAFEARLRQESLQALATGMLQSWAARQPLLLVLEDIHWMDEASLALTTAVGRAITHTPLLLLLSQRLAGDPSILPDLTDLPHHHHLALSELGAESMATLITQRLQGEVSPLALALIAARTEGNPFFIEELVDSLREAAVLVQEQTATGTLRWSLSPEMRGRLQQAGCVVQRADGWELAENAPLTAVDIGVPDSIQGIILSRIDRLPESHKLLLKVASVIGQRFELKLLTQAHPPVRPDLPQAQVQAQEMAARDFWRVATEQEGRSNGDTAVYAFRHNTTQEVSYEMLLFEQRRQLHRAVSEVMAELQPDDVSALAYHAFLGEDWARAVEYHLLAGQQEQKFALHEAIEHYQKALVCCERLLQEGGETTAVAASQLAIRLSLGELFTTTGQYELAEENLRLALAWATEKGDEHGRGRACRWLARLHELRGEYPPALDWIQEGLLGLSDLETAEAAEMMLIAGLINIRQGDYDNAASLCQQGMFIAQEINDLSVVARAHNLSGIIIRLRGNSAEAIAEFEQALDLYTQLNNIHGQALAQNQIATAWFDMGDWVKADTFYRQARATFIQLGDVYNQVALDNNLGGIALNQGRLDQALMYYEAALQSQKQTGGSLWVQGVLHMNLGHTFLRRGEVTQAREQLQISENYFHEAEARDFLPELYRLWAHAALVAKELDKAREQVEQSLTYAHEMGARSEEGIARRIKGKIAFAEQAWAEAVTELNASLQILDEVGDKYEGARTMLALAKLYAVQGQTAQKEELLVRCTAVFEELEAALDLAEAQEL